MLFSLTLVLKIRRGLKDAIVIYDTYWNSILYPLHHASQIWKDSQESSIIAPKDV